MRPTKLAIIILTAIILTPFAAKTVLAGTACPVPEVEFCLFSSIDQKAHGDRVDGTATAYYEPVDTGGQTIPDTCPGGPCVSSKKNPCPALCGDPQGHLVVFVRAQTRSIIDRFLMTVSTDSLSPRSDGTDPCDELMNPALEPVCKCRRDFAISNELDQVPLCIVTDQALAEELFLKFIETAIIPRLFPETPNAPFAVKSVSDIVINEDELPFYGILNFQLAVQN